MHPGGSLFNSAFPCSLAQENFACQSPLCRCLVMALGFQGEDSPRTREGQTRLPCVELSNKHSPAMRTDAVYLYLLNSKYSRINSLIRRFSWDNDGRGSRSSSRALNTSARILAFKCPNTPLFSKVSFNTVKHKTVTILLQNQLRHAWAHFEDVQKVNGINLNIMTKQTFVSTISRVCNAN